MEQGLSHLDARSGGSSTLPAPNGKGDIAVGMENFKPYDSAHYLETEEAIAAFLEDVMEDSDDDPAYVTRALGVVARARMLTQLANDAGMSWPHWKPFSPSRERARASHRLPRVRMESRWTGIASRTSAATAAPQRNWRPTPTAAWKVTLTRLCNSAACTVH